MARAPHLVRIVSSWWSIMFVFWTTSEIVCICVCVFHVFVFVCQRWRVLLWCAVWMLWAARELLPISSKATARVVAVVVVQTEGIVVEAKPERLHRSSLSHTCHLQYEQFGSNLQTHTHVLLLLLLSLPCSPIVFPAPSFWICPPAAPVLHTVLRTVLHNVLRTLLNPQCHEKPRLTKPATPESELRGNFSASPLVILTHYKRAQLWA